MGMERAKTVVHNVKTPSGQISYAEAGSGPIALFVHGVLLNNHLWRARRPSDRSICRRAWHSGFCLIRRRPRLRAPGNGHG
jgi:hypothetical protein